MGKIISAIVVVVLIVGGGYWYMQMNSGSQTAIQPESETAAGMDAMLPNTQTATTTGAAATAQSANVKEFTMTAYYDNKGKWYSVDKIDVKKGDTVRVKITNTAGMHDFVIDEYGVKKDLPLNQEVVVEFTADKVGAFEYYCSMPGHRAGGQWGTLTVTE
jgi:heme/copper-type cytochrome/quinol oxidase subunit 2